MSADPAGAPGVPPDRESGGPGGELPGLAVAAAAAPGLSSLGGAFMVSAQARTMAKEHGLRGWQAYAIGRGGVLGDVDPQVVAAGFAFLDPGMVRDAWTAARLVLSPAAGATAYAGVCAQWGRARLAGFADAEPLADLVEAVVAAADVAALPLFAGWRAVPVPTDPPARCAHLLHVARELRGGLHALAVRACGLRPVEAIVAGSGGTRNAAFFGWPEPYPPLTPGLAQARDGAERLTDRLAAPAFAVLFGGAGAELVRLLDAAAVAAAASG